MIILWVLVILTILVVSTGHRVSMALRLVKYQRDRLMALALAKAQVSRIMLELDKDIAWANKNAIIDAESKININSASPELLISLLEKHQVQVNQVYDPKKIADNIRAWRVGVAVPPVPKEATDYAGLGYACKEAPFANIEELKLVKDVTLEIYNSIKDHITVNGAGKININTAPEEILEVLINSCTKKLVVAQTDSGDLLEMIMELRTTNTVFASISELQNTLESRLNPAQRNVQGKFSDEGTTESTCFYIESCGTIGKTSNTINCIYDQVNKKVLFWHEG